MKLVVAGVDILQQPEVVSEYGESFAAGAVLFHQGAPAQTCYLIREGRVRAVQKASGRERNLRVAKTGELVGASALIPGGIRNATAIALSPCTVIAFTKAQLHDIMQRFPSVGEQIVEQLVLRTREAEEHLEISSVRDAQSRVVIGLLRAAQQQQRLEHSRENQILLHLSPLELSARVSLDVEAVKRTVQQLRERDYLRVTDEQLEICDLAALQELYNLLGARSEISG